jgi:hypothetical protein
MCSGMRLLRPVAAALFAAGTAATLVACDAGEGSGDREVASSGVPEITVPPAAPDPETAPETLDPVPAPVGNADGTATALATLDTLPVKGRAPKTGYDRALFGQRWADVDRNGCDTRNDILARDLTDVVLKEGSCRVLSGTLADPYTGRTIDFVRGQDTSTAVQIDHLVALSDAWQKGAQQLSPERREQLANDPANLLAVDGPANMQKRDGDAATWLPANKAFRCTYVTKQIDVKAAYTLWVTQAEKDAMVRVLSDCGAGIDGGQVAPEPAPAPAPEPGPAPAEVPVAPAEIPAPPAPAPAGGDDVYFANCAAARAAGAAPLYAGQPGYRPRMDGDNDGVACE